MNDTDQKRMKAYLVPQMQNYNLSSLQYHFCRKAEI